MRVLLSLKCPLIPDSGAKATLREVREGPETAPFIAALSNNGNCKRTATLGRYLFERRQAAGAVPNAFLKARENAASEP